MKVFISWSGERSQTVASALNKWLRPVLQNVEPFMSRHSIDAGSTWGTELDDELEETHFGILCVTPENAQSPWLLYEAGALAKSKAVSRARVVPYLIDMKSDRDLPAGPLNRFMAKVAATETLGVLSSINSALPRPFEQRDLEEIYAKWWPDLEGVLSSLPSSPTGIKTPDMADMVCEILGTVRGLARGSTSTWADPPAIDGRSAADIANADPRLMSVGIRIERLVPHPGKDRPYSIYTGSPMDARPLMVSIGTERRASAAAELFILAILQRIEEMNGKTTHESPADHGKQVERPL